MALSLREKDLTDDNGLEDELGVTSPGDKEYRWVREGSDLFRKLTHTEWYYKSGHTERVAGYGTETLHVSDHLPIDTVNSIEYDTGNNTTTVDSGDYEVIENEKGAIRKINGVWRDTAKTETNIAIHSVPGSEEKLFKVDYDGGYYTPEQDNQNVGTRDLPWDIERAVLEFVAMRSEQSGSNTAVQKVSVESGSITYMQGPGGGRIAVPASFKSAAMRYRLTGAGEAFA